MDSSPYKPSLLYDDISLFPKGMNSGLDPLLLEKDQLAFAVNATVREGFLGNRPPYSKTHLLMSWPTDAIKDAVEEGLFQGAGYYQPDSGDQSLFAQISGRLFQFVVNGNAVTVAEQTVVGDPNDALSTQAWMWQSENFFILQNGIALPVFFDGASSRRSFGPSVVLGSVTGGEVVPPIGDTFNAALATPYTGQFNVPVLIDGFYFQPVEAAAGYLVEATSLFDIPGTPIPIDTPVTTVPAIAFVIAGPVGLAGGFAVNAALNFNITTPYTGAIGATVIIFGKIWRVTAASANTVSVAANQSGTYTSLAAGTKVQFSSSSAPSVLIGNVVLAATAPAIGGTVQIRLSNAFSGTPGQVVYIGAQGQYSIVAVPPPPPGAGTIDLININFPADGTATLPAGDILSVPELPAGRMGAYGLGQNWMCLVDGFSFICSDTSRGPSGTQANSFRDSVLKTTDLTFRGGNFSIPGAGNVISSMTFTANLDLSLGQGSLQVGTPAFMASCLAPINFASPPTNGPILTFSLIGSGPLAQNSTIRVNSDIYFRSTFGLGSLIQARRDFTTPGNTPISEEMRRVFSLDNQKLLPYGSSTVFDNRFLTTVSPQASSQGVIHAGLVAQNLDPVSGIMGKQPPVYDGLWTGLNVLQLVSGIFAGVERCFAFTFNVSLSKIELYEIFPNGTENFDDSIIPIVWSFETPALFNSDIKPRNIPVSLRDGEFAVSEVVGTVRFDVYYKADQGCWTPWHSFSICSSKEGGPQYFPRLGLGEPTSNRCDSITNTTSRDGYTFQFKFVITGHCRFLRARFAAVTLPMPKFEPPICNLNT